MLLNPFIAPLMIIFRSSITLINELSPYQSKLTVKIEIRTAVGAIFKRMVKFKVNVMKVSPYNMTSSELSVVCDV